MRAPKRKVHFGYSVYDLGGGAARVREVRESLRRGAAVPKAWLEEHRRKVRWVTSREPTLSSVIVVKNKLLPEENGVEVLVLVGTDRILLARTLAVQPFAEWGRRDYGRPNRDARSGMLPPKLARAMVNIAIARNSKLKVRSSKQIQNFNAQNVKGPDQRFALLDPFCGSGTILTEAMALGIPKIIGTDVSAEAVEDAKANVAWMRGRKDFSPSREGERLVPRSLARPAEPWRSWGGVGEGEGSASIHVQHCDVRQLSRCVRDQVDAIVTEPYLGPPVRGKHRRLRSPAEPGGKPPVLRSALGDDLRALYLSAFREFAKVLKPGGRVVFIVPIFREREGVLDITRDVVQFGFHRTNPFPASLRDHPALRGKEDLPYARPDQRVGRKILAFALTRGSIE